MGGIVPGGFLSLNRSIGARAKMRFAPGLDEKRTGAMWICLAGPIGQHYSTYFLSFWDGRVSEIWVCVGRTCLACMGEFSTFHLPLFALLPVSHALFGALHNDARILACSGVGTRLVPVTSRRLGYAPASTPLPQRKTSRPP